MLSVKSNGICRRLGVSEAVLRSAEQTYPLHTEGAPANRFMYALKDWYDGNGRIDGKPVPVTYAVLCEALKQSRCIRTGFRGFEEMLVVQIYLKYY